MVLFYYIIDENLAFLAIGSTLLVLDGGALLQPLFRPDPLVCGPRALTFSDRCPWGLRVPFFPDVRDSKVEI